MLSECCVPVDADGVAGLAELVQDAVSYGLWARKFVRCREMLCREGCGQME